MTRENLRINAERLLRRLDELGRIGALEGGGNCRLAFSDEDKAGRDLVLGWMRAAGLDIRIDKFGNVTATRPGREDGPPVMAGSHTDTVATGGKYDGNLGVLAGLEAIETLNDAGIETRRPVAVTLFSNEEGARFSPDMMGSLVYRGGLPLEEAYGIEGIDGSTVGENLERIGYIGDAPVGGNEVHAFVELHIEQGPILEDEGRTIGAVEGVQGISWTEYTFTGRSAHAGTTPMSRRCDAGYVAAEVAAYVRRLAGETGNGHVSTVGVFEVEPDLVNVVPQKAKMTADLRNFDNELLKQAEQKLDAFVDDVAAREGAAVARRTLARFDPTPFDTGMVDRIHGIAERLGYSTRRIASGAGHDAQIMARICPTAMIFVPSVDGISHNIQEYTKAEDCEAGANVMLHTLLELAE
jgi:N-carbamoyl-L-amino-acid hydrolase